MPERNDTFAFFRYYHHRRWAHFWMITSETCANCCGITYAAHFKHPERCPALYGYCRAVAHDDRLDAVAGAVAHFQRAMMMDVDQSAKAMRDEEMLAEIEDFLEGFNQPTLPWYAGRWGSGGNLVIPARLERDVETAAPY